MLMLGNLLKVSGVVDRLSRQHRTRSLTSPRSFFGLSIGATMSSEAFLNWDTGKIMLLGLLAFGLDTFAGLLFGKLMAVMSGGKINPLIGAAGISAFPMADGWQPRPPTTKIRIILF